VRAYLARGSITRATTDSAAFSLVAGAHVDGAIGRSTIDLQSPRLELVSRGVSVAGDAHARLRAHDLRLDKGDCVLDEASLVFTRVAISPEKRRLDVRPAVTVAEISLRASSARLAFADPFARMAISAALVDGRVHDSASLSTLLPHDAIAAIESDGATFSADAHGALNHRVWSGAARAKISGVGLGGAQVHARGNASLVIDAATINLAEHTARFEGAALLVDHVTGRFSGEAPQFQIRRALIFGRAARIELASPSLAGVDLTVGVDGLVLGDVRDATPLLPKDSVLGLESGRLTASLSFVLSSTETTVHGTLDADLRDGGVRFHTAHYEGNFALRGAVVAMDRTGRVLDVSGSTLAMRDVLVTHTAMATSRWHGDLDFEHATVHLGAPFSIDAYVALDARDADPLLAVALGDDLPSMLTGLAQMPRLKATAHVDIGSGMFSIRDIDATGGDLTIHGVYAARAHHVRGGFAIDKGPVSIGVRLDDHGAQPYLFNLDRWLLDQEEAARHLIEDDPVAPTAPVPTAISAG
jgi:hypothetical protein